MLISLGGKQSVDPLKTSNRNEQDKRKKAKTRINKGKKNTNEISFFVCFCKESCNGFLFD